MGVDIGILIADSLHCTWSETEDGEERYQYHQRQTVPLYLAMTYEVNITFFIHPHFFVRHFHARSRRAKRYVSVVCSIERVYLDRDR